MRLKSIRHLWGVEEPYDVAFPKIKKEGFDGVEIPLALVRDFGVEKFKQLLAEHALDYVAMVFTDGPLAYSQKEDNPRNDFFKVSQHVEEFRAQLHDVRELNPLFVNSHSGKDWFSLDEAKEFFTAALQIEKESGIKVCHETHRKRILYSPWVVRDIVPLFPDLKLTADLSHFVVVSETHPDDRKLTEVVKLIAPRVMHVHARVGYEQGPQVPDPRAPEWEEYVAAHEVWWEIIWDSQRERGMASTTVTPEFGPPNYMHTLPYTKQPVACLWDICNYMRVRVFTRFETAMAKTPSGRPLFVCQ